MDLNLTRPFSGMYPPYTRIELHLEPSGYCRLDVAQAEGPGFVFAGAVVSYALLSYAEALDVIAATLDGLGSD